MLSRIFGISIFHAKDGSLIVIINQGGDFRQFIIWKCADWAFGIFSPAFAPTKAEKTFGFRVNQVYLRWVCVRNSGPSSHRQIRTTLLYNSPLFSKPDRSEHSDPLSE